MDAENKNRLNGIHENFMAKPICPIPQRSTQAIKTMLDLTEYYNFSLDDEIHHKPQNTLTTLPKGLKNFGGIQFDVRGLIQLEGSISKEKTQLDYPNNIKNIAVDNQAKTIHFLQASAWNDAQGRCIGEYLMHYENGKTEQIPIIYGENVMDWWGKPDEKGIEPVWKGENPRTKELGFFLRIFIFSWKNPYPELKIKSLDFISKMQESAPILFAVKLE